MISKATISLNGAFDFPQIYFVSTMHYTPHTHGVVKVNFLSPRKVMHKLSCRNCILNILSNKVAFLD